MQATHDYNWLHPPNQIENLVGLTYSLNEIKVVKATVLGHSITIYCQLLSDEYFDELETTFHYFIHTKHLIFTIEYTRVSV